MLMTEWNWDDALAVQYKEGMEYKQEEIAKNALAEGISIELVKKIIGLDDAAIRKLQEELSRDAN
jgi:predicted transposase YdaD